MDVVSRYFSTRKMMGRYYGSSSAVNNIRAAMSAGTLPYSQTITTGAQRLDTIAGREYGDGRYWWIIAAVSNVGWGLQVPTGTIIKIPQLNVVNQLVLIE